MSLFLLLLINKFLPRESRPPATRTHPCNQKWHCADIHDDDIKWKHFPRYWPFVQLALWNSPVTGEFPPQRPQTRSFDVSLICVLNKLLSEQSWGWWFETPSHLWRHCNVRGHLAPMTHTLLINTGFIVNFSYHASFCTRTNVECQYISFNVQGVFWLFIVSSSFVCVLMWRICQHSSWLLVGADLLT